MNKKDFDCSISHVHKLMTLFIFMYNAISKSDIKPSKINNWFDSDLNQGEPHLMKSSVNFSLAKKIFSFTVKYVKKLRMLISHL